jgi:hypothetical protein
MSLPAGDRSTLAAASLDDGRKCRVHDYENRGGGDEQPENLRRHAHERTPASALAEKRIAASWSVTK